MMLEADRFFWAMLDGSSLPRSRRRDRRALGYLFESELPLPIEQVHAAYLRVESDRVIACGLASQQLQSIVNEHPEALTLAPASVPGFLGSDFVDARQLNLLTERFEPASLRRGRWRLTVQAASLGVVVLIVLLLGLERRTTAERDGARDLRDARRELIERSIGSLPAAAAHQPPELRFLAELRTLRQTRQAPAGDQRTSGDQALLALAALAQRWPRELHVMTESISLTPTSITLRAMASSSAEVQILADALGALELNASPSDPSGAISGWGEWGGWQAQQPQISVASPEKVDATLHWRRVRSLQEPRS